MIAKVSSNSLQLKKNPRITKRLDRYIYCGKKEAIHNHNNTFEEVPYDYQKRFEEDRPAALGNS